VETTVAEADPLVTVVLPTHNRSDVLGRAVHSVLGQTYETVELVVVDDASTDGTRTLVASVADPRLRVVRLPSRVGPGAARNAGIAVAEGDLFAFQDSDDEWLPGKLARQVALLRASDRDVGWIGGSYVVARPGGHELIMSDNLVHGRPYDEDLVDGRPFVTPTWLVHRDVLAEAGPFREDLENLEDWDLIFRLADVCRFRAVGPVVLVKHGSPDSLFGDTARLVRAYETMLTDHRARFAAHPTAHARHYVELGRLHAALGHRATARRMVRTAMTLGARRPAAYALLAATWAPDRVLHGVARR
jgi:glycosyltransferase involved in cell wall biosynthesis